MDTEDALRRLRNLELDMPEQYENIANLLEAKNRECQAWRAWYRLTDTPFLITTEYGQTVIETSRHCDQLENK